MFAKITTIPYHSVLIIAYLCPIVTAYTILNKQNLFYCMKNLTLLICCFMISICNAQAQLPNGSIAPDFTLTDINGNTHHLYDYLNQGKGVLIVFSATWCNPCWNFHSTDVLENTYEQYGPNGSNELMVFFIESDPGTTLAQLQGIGSTQGNWTAGTTFPMFNPSTSAVVDAYAIDGVPTLYRICPNRTIEEVPASLSLTTSYLRSRVVACPQAATGNDPALLAYTGEATFCSQVEPIVMLQNNGTLPLTQATITAMAGTQQLASVNWTGNLTTYNTANVSLGNIPLSTATTVQFIVTSASGNIITSNDQISKLLLPATTTNGTIVVDMYSDNWTLDDQTRFFIEDGNGNTVPGTLTTNIPELQTLSYTFSIPPAANCYRFVIQDGYGDGMTYSSGSINVHDSNGTSIFNNANFGSEGDSYFNVPLQIPTVRLKAYLEGTYNLTNANMNTTASSLLPLQQPYNTAPWNYTGTESVTTIPTGAVDWVLIEARDANNPSLIIDQAAAWLLNNGNVVDYQNTSQGVRFNDLNSGSSYLFVVRHRNHLAVMSRLPVTVTSAPHTTIDYDFTNAVTQAIGGNQLKLVGTNAYALFAGDVDGNGIINAFNDYNTYVNTSNMGYKLADINLNGLPDSGDINLWKNNVGKLGIVELRY